MKKFNTQFKKLNFSVLKYLTFFCLINSAFSQNYNRGIDSLLLLLNDDAEDTSKVNHLRELSRDFKYLNSDTAIILGNQALVLAEKIGWKKGISVTLFQLGAIYITKNEFEKAHKFNFSALKKAEETNNLPLQLDILFEIGNTYFDQTEYNQAKSYYLKAIKIAEHLDDIETLSNLVGNVGLVYESQSDFRNALEYYFKALHLAEERKNKERISFQLGNIGNIYWNLGEFPNAIDYYFKTLKLFQETGNKKGEESILGNIGNVYWNQGNLEKAMEYHNKALKMAKEANNKDAIAIHLGNIGIVYWNLASSPTKNTNDREKLYTKSLESFEGALKEAEECNNKGSSANILINLAGLLKEQAEHITYAGLGENQQKLKLNEQKTLLNKALEYYFKALVLAEEMGIKSYKVAIFCNVGSIYITQNNFKSACDYLYKSLALSDSIGAKVNSKETYETLSILYEKSMIALPDSGLYIPENAKTYLSTDKMRLRSLYYYKRAIAIKDTLFSEENKKQIVQKEMNYEFEKKQALIKAEQEKKDGITKIIIFSVSVGFILVFIFAVFILRGFRQKQKANLIIEAQKHEVEEKQKEIIDSIRYAKRIQQALMPVEKHIEKSLKRLQKK